MGLTWEDSDDVICLSVPGLCLTWHHVLKTYPVVAGFRIPFLFKAE